MAERPKHWVKLWVSWLTTPAHVELSAGALGLGPLLMLLTRWDGEYESGGWLLGESGLPLSRDALARATHRSRKQLDAEVDELVTCGTLTVLDGAIGFVGFGRWQESKSAARMRHARSNGAAHSDAHSASNGAPHSESIRATKTTDDRRQNSLRSSTPNPSAEGDLPGLIGAETPAELVERSKPPKRKVKPRADPPEGLAEHVLAELHRACRDLDGPTAGPRHTAEHPPFLDQLAKLHAAHAPTPEEWSAVIAERLALSREARRTGQPEFGSLTVTSLCVPSNFERWLASSRARSSGRPSAPVVRRGPAPPSPRPTSSGAVDLDGGDA